MGYMMELFDDNCEELKILRWFRDNYVFKEDINYYYKTAPIIVEVIDKMENNYQIYKYVYTNVVSVCVNAIKNDNYYYSINIKY